MAQERQLGIWQRFFWGFLGIIFKPQWDADERRRARMGSCKVWFFLCRLFGVGSWCFPGEIIAELEHMCYQQVDEE
jgi:hypothetical protein